jgi:putative transposase
MCRQAGVSRSGYYSYAARKEGRAASARESRDYADFALVRTVFDYKGRPKGSRTISMMMPRLFGVAMNRKKVRRLMRKYGLECPARRANPLKRIAKAIQSNAVFSNKLNRQFAVGRPGENLLTDISYIRYGPHLEKLCFLSALKDASTNEIVAWTLSESLAVGFVIDMLRKLDSVKWLPDAVLIHSDQGCHYTSYAYVRFLSDAGIAQSMSRRGNCWDNAPMGVLLRARQGRAFAPPMLGFRGRPRGDVLVHRLLQQRPPADGARQDDARGIPRLPPRQGQSGCPLS